jgi:hypothetical protein
VASEVGERTRLREAIASKSLPSCYYKHPVVMSASEDELVIPIAVYLDFVPYALNDSVLGLWVQNMINDRRYLFAVFRKRTACICGCRAWCSLHALLSALAWSLRAMAVGKWPSTRHDLEPWLDTDKLRSARSGEDLPFKAAVIFIKGDWSEFSHSLGLPTWQDGLRPCWACVDFGEDRYNTEACTK